MHDIAGVWFEGRLLCQSLETKKQRWKKNGNNTKAIVVFSRKSSSVFSIRREKRAKVSGGGRRGDKAICLDSNFSKVRVVWRFLHKAPEIDSEYAWILVQLTNVNFDKQHWIEKVLWENENKDVCAATKKRDPIIQVEGQDLHMTTIGRNTKRRTNTFMRNGEIQRGSRCDGVTKQVQGQKVENEEFKVWAEKKF